MNLRTVALAAAATLAAAAPAATAATPAEGTLTLDAPLVEWSGEAMGSAIQYAHFFYGEQIVDDCVAPVCDSFTLTVADEGNIEISVEDPTGYTEVQIKDADGNEIFWNEGVESGPTVFTEYEFEPGVYTVEVLTDAIAPAPFDDPSYTASARFFEDEPEEPVEEEEF